MPTKRKKLQFKANKAVIETGLKAFDKFCNYLGTGNIISDGQLSSYIRPSCETECNGKKFKKGELRDFDLAPFRTHKLPKNVEIKILERTKESPIILSLIYHITGKRETKHGYILTHGEEKNHELIEIIPTGPTSKSHDVLTWCAPYISTRGKKNGNKKG